VDELNAALGVARAAEGCESAGQKLLTIQKELVSLMGELATLPEDMPRYVRDGYPQFAKAAVDGIETFALELEARKPAGEWAMPGANPRSAAMDMARTICRRAERRVCALQEAGQLQNAAIPVYLNRLSDLLWLWARAEESGAAKT
jgi:cob(I)alamin adenosyltransferase